LTHNLFLTAKACIALENNNNINGAKLKEWNQALEMLSQAKI